MSKLSHHLKQSVFQKCSNGTFIAVRMLSADLEWIRQQFPVQNLHMYHRCEDRQPADKLHAEDHIYLLPANFSRVLKRHNLVSCNVMAINHEYS